MRFILFWVVYFIGINPTLAQKERNNWYFGNLAGITFNTVPPTALTDSKMVTREGCSSVSDASGNLLFYTEGRNIWNKAHDLMDGGTNLSGDASSTHSSVVIKQPLSNRYYFLITSDSYENRANSKGVNFSLIDMALNGGLGKVIDKNKKLLPESTEKLSAVLHANAQDIWFATLKNNTNQLLAYKISALGFDTIPVISTIPFVQAIELGQMKFAPDGSKMAFVSKNELFLVDFNHITGTFSNCRRAFSSTFNFYGLEFSPDSKLLYVNGSFDIYQIANFNFNDQPIGTIGITIGSNTNTTFQMQLGPDSRIYVARDGQSFLGVIDKPNIKGSGCNFISNSVSLGGKICLLGLPVFIQSIIADPALNYDTICQFVPNEFTLSIDTTFLDSLVFVFKQGTDSVKLSTQSTSITYSPINAGSSILIVKTFYADSSRNARYQYPITIYPQPKVQLGADTSICAGQTLLIGDQSMEAGNYLWNTLDTLVSISINTPNEYILVKEKFTCTNADTIRITEAITPTILLIPSTYYCLGSGVTLNATVSDALQLLWNTGDTVNSIFVQTPGNYTLTAKSAFCEKVATTNVTERPFPKVNLGPDTSICIDQSIALAITEPFATAIWNDGNQNLTRTIRRAGTYFVTIDNGCGQAMDTVAIETRICNCNAYIPNVFTPNNDGQNDTYMPVFSCPIVEYKLAIYNRFGQLVFETTNPTMGWNGQSKVNISPSDVYAYILSYSMVTDSGRIVSGDKNGTVTLIR